MAGQTRARTAEGSRPVTAGHLFGVKYYKFKKFGKGPTAWLAFSDWMRDIIGRTCEINDLRDHEAVDLINAMRRLHDVPPEGQETLF